MLFYNLSQSVTNKEIYFGPFPGRLIAYPDTQFHRLGPNYMQIPINCPYKTHVANTQIDGNMVYISSG